MADVFTVEKRSAIMARIKGENTKPEILVRKIVHSLGYRFRVHSNSLRGKPDIVFARHRKLIFVHGCFWHGHAKCSRARLPSTNIKFWQTKIRENALRDTRVKGSLNRSGWRILVVWQCQTKNVEALTQRLRSFLEK